MDAGFLERLLGGSRSWAGSCVVLMDSASNMDVAGPDSIVTGGQKSALMSPSARTQPLESWSC